jgi:hypothetical protein
VASQITYTKKIKSSSIRQYDYMSEYEPQLYRGDAVYLHDDMSLSLSREIGAAELE